MARALAETRLYREIHEQPDVLQRVLERQADAVRELAQVMRTRHIGHVIAAARGTSDNAARYAQYLLGARNRLPVGLAAPSLFTVYGAPPRLGEALVMGISQSGRSPDIVAVLAEARRQGALTAVLTNDPASDLAAQGDFVIDLCAGEEKAVAATKTYTAVLAALALLSATLAEDEAGRAEVLRVPGAVAEALALARGQVGPVAERLQGMDRAVVIGRGFNYATAFELALKLKELTYTIVEPYSSADFLHGPLAMLEHGFPVLLLAPSGQLRREMAELTAKLRERQADVVCVSDLPEMRALAQASLEVPGGLPEWLSPITLIVPGQLLAAHISFLRGIDVDAPRAIRKITTTR